MSTIQYQPPNRLISKEYFRCDYCQKVIGVDVSIRRYWEDSDFDIHLCYECRDKGIVFCQDCMKPHPKKQAHRITCSQCYKQFTATIEYMGLVCPKCKGMTK